MALRRRRSSLERQLKAGVAREGTITIPNNDRRNEQVTDIHQASLERVGGEGRPADGEVSCRRGFLPLNRLDLEMLLNMRSGSGCGLQSPGVDHLVCGPPYVREICNAGRLIMRRQGLPN